MRLSIRAWTILALNAFVIGLSIILGWIAQDVAGQVVEERFAKEMVTSVSGFLKNRTFPLSDAMMTYLREMFNAEWVATEGKVTNVVGASLPDKLTQEFKQQVAQADPASVMTLGGEQYRIDFAEIPASISRGDARAIPSTTYRLYMLVPYAQFKEARNRASTRVARVVLPTSAVATVLAFLLAFGITRPIRKLANGMDRLAINEDADSASPAPDGIGAEDAKERRIGEKGYRPQRRGLRGPKEIARLAASFYDLLDRLALARRRLAQNDRLATLGKICLSVAHELRNPLSGIKMNVRVLKDRMGPTEDSGIEAILREIDRMGLYLNELMSLSPGNDNPARAMPLEPVKLSELADSVLTILAGRCRHAKVSVQRDYPAAEPLVSADGNQLRQTMMNLMVNAIEAMPAGGTMTISVQPRPSTICFTATDTGKGVQENGKDIFEAFSSGKPNGVGLGLYLCKQIIGNHGGRIGYDSTDHGAVFWFELPRQAVTGPADEAGAGENAESGKFQ